MGNITKTKYRKKNMTKDWLLANGFRYSRLLSDDEAEVYTYRFPVYKYNKFTVLECEFKVALGEEIISVNVYDYNTNDKYAPFYYCEYGNYDNMLKEINGKIEGVLKKMKIYREEK
ncbi:MAG: hypothetical protein HDR18_09525 [Lachnospiraceae bacterium]|nr:hypothetical protein [Lachnospiraceae bacterium]